MGIYNAANQWKMVFLYIPSAMANVVLPMMTRMNLSTSSRSSKRFFWANLICSVAAGLVGVLISVLFGSYIMTGYGDEYRGTENVLQAISIVALLMAFNNVIGQTITSRGRFWVGVIFNANWAALLLIAAYLLVPEYGALGLAVASMLAYGAHSLWQMTYVLHLMRGERDK